MHDEIKDRRVRKTKLAIHQALLSLMEKKPISDISVLELTAAADVNRKTFYNHYNGIYAVLDEVEDDCVEHLVSLLTSIDAAQYIDNPASFFIKLIHELTENRAFHMLLNQSQAYSHISQKLIRREKEILRDIMGDISYNEAWADCFLNFISAGTTSVINNWFSSGQQIPADSLAEFFGILFTSTDVRRFIHAVPYAASGSSPK